jgi:hypothetical protein
MPEISPEAQALIDRLACVDPARPRSDKATIERAIALHLAELELPERPCVWAEGALASYRIVAARGEGHEDAALLRKTDVRTAADDQVTMANDAQYAPFAARMAATDILRLLAPHDAETMVRAAADVAGFDPASYRGVNLALQDAIEAVGFANDHAVFKDPATAKAARVWLHLFDAFEAGLFLYWITSHDVVCVLQPVLAIVNGRLHRTDGPAIEWPSGETFYLRHGARLHDTARIRPEAEVLLGRLARMQPAPSPTDRAAVERGVTAYLERLGLASRPVVWADDAQAGYRHVAAAWRSRGAAWAAARTGDSHAVAWDAAVYEAEAGLNGDLRRIPVEVARAGLAGTLAALPLTRSDTWKAVSNAAFEAAGRAGTLLSRRTEGTVTLCEGAVVEQTRSCARHGEHAVHYANMLALLPHPTLEKLARSSLAMFEAFEAGLCLYWITPDEVVCVPRPSLSLEDDWLHHSCGPAARWPTGEAYYFWHGTPIPDWAITQPERITVGAIHAEREQDVRRAITEIYGLSRYLAEAGARRVRADDHCRLWEVRVGDETWRVVEVEDAGSSQTRRRIALWSRFRWTDPPSDPSPGFTVDVVPHRFRLTPGENPSVEEPRFLRAGPPPLTLGQADLGDSRRAPMTGF